MFLTRQLRLSKNSSTSQSGFEFSNDATLTLTLGATKKIGLVLTRHGAES